MYKMCYGFLDGKWEDYLIPNRERRTQGSHDIFRFSFFPRTITECNKPPLLVVYICSFSCYYHLVFFIVLELA